MVFTKNDGALPTLIIGSRSEFNNETPSCVYVGNVRWQKINHISVCRRLWRNPAAPRERMY